MGKTLTKASLDATPTHNGDKLADKLLPLIGYTPEIRGTCALICRHAATLHRLSVEDCNGHPARRTAHTPEGWARVDQLQANWDARIEREMERTERRLRDLIDFLPATDAGPFTAILGGDPRGCVAIIGLPAELIRHADDWGRQGICVPYERS